MEMSLSQFVATGSRFERRISLDYPIVSANDEWSHVVRAQDNVTPGIMFLKLTGLSGESVSTGNNGSRSGRYLRSLGTSWLKGGCDIETAMDECRDK